MQDAALSRHVGNEHQAHSHYGEDGRQAEHRTGLAVPGEDIAPTTDGGDALALGVPPPDEHVDRGASRRHHGRDRQKEPRDQQGALPLPRGERAS